MSLFSSMRRILNALFGKMLESAEDPRLILKQNIRDLNEQVPRLNEHIAMVRANLTLLENEKARLERRIPELRARIKAALRAGRRDVALNYATTLEEIQDTRNTNSRQIELAQTAFEKALKIKQAFMKEKERKTREAIQAIRAAERADWQRKIADAMDSFEATGIDHTHDEMIARINNQAAMDRARLELALDTVDDENIQIEEEVRKLEANEIVRRFETELGIGYPLSDSPSPSEPSSGELPE